MRALRLVALTCAVLLARASQADTLGVDAQFDAPSATKGDVVNYTISLSGSNLPRGIQAPMPPFSDFEILGGPSTSTSSQISFVNGQVSSQTLLTLTWALQPKKDGQLSVAAFAMQVGGQQVQVPAASLPVGAAVPGQARQQPSPGRGRARPDNRWPWDPLAEQQRQPRRQSTRRLELHSSLENSSSWVGEEIILFHVLDFEGQVSSYTLGKPVDLPGFSKSDNQIKDPKTERVRDPQTGAVFQRATIARWTLVPLTPGPQEIPEQPYTLTVVDEASGGFPGFFGEQRQVERAAPAVHLDVRPLPPGAPASFGGAVGVFRMNLQVDRTSVNQGDGITLTVQMTGTGSFDRVKAPEFSLPEGFRLFDPEVKTESSRDATGRSAGSKTFRFPVLINGSGSLLIPEIEWSYFDPKAGRYVTRSADPITIAAAPSALPPPASFAPGLQPVHQDVQEVAQDIEHVRSDAGQRKDVNSRRRAPGWLLPLLLAGPCACGLLGLVRVGRNLARRDPGAQRRAQALGSARALIKQGRNLTAAGKPREACDCAARALQGYVSDKLLLEDAAPSPADVTRHLAAWGGEELARSVGATLSECDFARFTSSVPADAARLVADSDRHLDALSRLSESRSAAS